jgi:hypothetical protein
MAAIDNKNLLEILSINVQSGVSKKTGQPFSLPKAQCILKSGDGTIRIGELMLPKDMAETKPGKYLAEFELDVSFDLRVVPRVIALHAYADKPVLSPAAAAAQKTGA